MARLGRAPGGQAEGKLMRRVVTTPSSFLPQRIGDRPCVASSRARVRTRERRQKMTRALLGCTIVLTLALTAHAQSFDPLYKPKPGDEAIIGRPLLFYSQPEVEMALPKVIFA